MEYTTWGYKIGENGKIMPTKTSKVLSAELLNKMADQIKGNDLTR